MPEQIFRIGTRGSDLARWQADHVASLLKQTYPDCAVEIVIFSTKGDEIIDKPLPSIGGKGLFTEALEDALRENAIDCAVHSLKDLPTDDAPGLITGAIPVRAMVNDVLVSRDGIGLDRLPQRATVGTSSRRRAAQLLYRRPDLRIIDIRGNVPTRINKTLDPDGPYDATVLAQAGVERLNLMPRVTEVLALAVMLPAPGQGALGIQCRADDESRRLFAPLTHVQTALAAQAERAFLKYLGGGCAVPVAAHGLCSSTGSLQLEGRVIALDGSRVIEVSGRVRVDLDDYRDSLANVRELGHSLAEEAFEEGADTILDEVEV